MLWVTLAIYIGFPTAAALMGKIDVMLTFMPLSGISGIAFIAITIIYVSRMHQIKKSIKTLERTKKLNYVNEIISGDYNSNDKVGFSKHLLYDKKTRMVVAYDDIVWVYKHSKDRYNIEVLFCTIDGKKHSSSIDDHTLVEFLKRRSGILIGFSAQNKEIYKNKVNEFNNKR